MEKIIHTKPIVVTNIVCDDTNRGVLGHCEARQSSVYLKVRMLFRHEERCTGESVGDEMGFTRNPSNGKIKCGQLLSHSLQTWVWQIKYSLFEDTLQGTMISHHCEVG